MFENVDFTMLALRYFDRLTDEREDADLQATLKESAQYREEFVELCRQHGLVSEVMKADSWAAVPKRLGRRAPAERVPIRWGLWVSVAVCITIVVVANLINLRQAERFSEILVGKIISANNVVYIERHGKSITVYMDMKLFTNDVLRTGRNSTAKVKYEAEKTTVDLLSDTEVKFFEANGAKRIYLDRGHLGATVALQPKDRHLVVISRHAEAEVVGTTFHLIARRDSTAIEVTEGLVRFTRLLDGKSVDVAARFSAMAGAGIELAAVVRHSIVYRKGNVIFRDDFESGDMESKWEMEVMEHIEGWKAVKSPGDTKQRFDPEAAKCIRQESLKVFGKRSRVAVLDASGLKGGTLILMPHFTGSANTAVGGVSIEFDRRTSLHTGVAHLFCKDVVKENRPVFKDQSHLNDGWYRIRIEFVWRHDQSGASFDDVKLWTGGELVEHRQIYGGESVFGIAVTRGVAMVDNVVIWNMVPVEPAEEKGGDDVR